MENTQQPHHALAEFVAARANHRILKENFYFLAILIPIVIDLIITKFFMKYMVTPKWIKARFLWQAFDLYKILLQIVAGIVKSLVRFVLVLVTVLFSLPRLDRSPFPAWVEMYLLLDSGSKSCERQCQSNPRVYAIIG